MRHNLKRMRCATTRISTAIPNAKEKNLTYVMSSKLGFLDACDARQSAIPAAIPNAGKMKYTSSKQLAFKNHEDQINLNPSAYERSTASS